MIIFKGKYWIIRPDKFHAISGVVKENVTIYHSLANKIYILLCSAYNIICIQPETEKSGSDVMIYFEKSEFIIYINLYYVLTEQCYIVIIILNNVFDEIFVTHNIITMHINININTYNILYYYLCTTQTDKPST